MWLPNPMPKPESEFEVYAKGVIQDVELSIQNNRCAGLSLKSVLVPWFDWALIHGRMSMKYARAAHARRSCTWIVSSTAVVLSVRILHSSK